MPAIRSGTGADVFTLRLQAALVEQGVEAIVTWFPLWCELFPERLRRARISNGTNLIYFNAWVGASFVRRGLPAAVTVQHLVYDPAYAPFRSPAGGLRDGGTGNVPHMRWLGTLSEEDRREKIGAY